MGDPHPSIRLLDLGENHKKVHTYIIVVLCDFCAYACARTVECQLHPFVNLLLHYFLTFVLAGSTCRYLFWSDGCVSEAVAMYCCWPYLEMIKATTLLFTSFFSNSPSAPAPQYYDQAIKHSICTCNDFSFPSWSVNINSYSMITIFGLLTTFVVVGLLLLLLVGSVHVVNLRSLVDSSVRCIQGTQTCNKVKLKSFRSVTLTIADSALCL